MNRKLKLLAMFMLFFAWAVISCSSTDDPSPTYTVTYDGNTHTAGTVPMDTKTYSSTFTVTVLGNGDLTKEGYSFTCWNTQADGNGTDRAPGSTFAMGSANETLYAKWTADPTYTVTYNANSGAGGVPVDGNNYLEGATATVLGSGTLTKGGYDFTCWNTQADGHGTDSAPGSTFTIGAADVILYAKWTADPTYTVTYNANGGIGGVPVDCNRYLEGATATVLGNSTLTNTGYYFAGWNTRTDGQGTDRVPGSTFKMGAAHVLLYAKWTPWRCGDGIVTAGEACDDGNTVDTDACRNDCTLPFCGDGIVQAGEACDDGNTVDTDACRNDCTLPPADGDIAGSVTDFVTKAAIQGVSATLEGTAWTAVSMADGAFTFSDVTAGDYTLKLSHPDYLDKSVPITVTSGNVTDADSEMNPAVIFSTVGNTGWFSATYPTADANGRYAEVALDLPVTIDYASLAFVKAEMAFDGEYADVGEAGFAAYMGCTQQLQIVLSLDTWWVGNGGVFDQPLGSAFIAAPVPNHYVVDVTTYVRNNPNARYFMAFRNYATNNIRLQNIQLKISYK